MRARNKDMDEDTRNEWRELGFYYERDTNNHLWLLTGARKGLLKFCDLLMKYASSARNGMISEHQHYGPYCYLEIMTWSEPQINEHAISGTLTQLRKLSGICREKLDAAIPGDMFIIDSEYSKNNKYKLQLIIKEDDYDPAKADAQLGG